MMITMETCPKGVAFILDGVPVGIALATNGANDRYIPVDNGVVCWIRETTVPVSSMEMRFDSAYAPVHTMIPAVLYDDNRVMDRSYFAANKRASEAARGRRSYFEGGTDPKTGKPHRIIYRRTPVPGATYSEGNRISFGMFLPLGQHEGACSLYKEDGHAVHAVLWPAQDTMNPDEPGSAPAIMEPRCEFRAMLVFAPVVRPRTAWHKLMDTAWEQYTVRCIPFRSQEEIWDLGVDFAKQLYTEENDGFKGFSIGFEWHDGWKKRDNQKYEIGWCGQNASLANSLITHALRFGDEEAGRIGIDVLDSWIRATRPNGLVPTRYDENIFTNGFEKTVDACNLGVAAVQFFEAEDLARQLGYKRPEYGKAARDICAFAMRVMDENGRIGKSWLEKDLSPAIQEGTTGAFLTLALCEMARRNGDPAALEAAERSCRYYCGTLIHEGYTTAGALDIFTIDKESCIPLFKSALRLYEITGRKDYLTMAEDAAYYLSTWQWSFTVRMPAGSELEEMKYDTYGGTNVSIHGGTDTYQMFYVNDLLKLAGYTGDKMWEERAAAAWRHGQNYISDGTYVLGGRGPRPRGGQDEGLGFSLETQRKTSHWLVAWPTAFRLETLRAHFFTDGTAYTVVI